MDFDNASDKTHNWSALGSKATWDCLALISDVISGVFDSVEASWHTERIEKWRQIAKNALANVSSSRSHCCSLNRLFYVFFFILEKSIKTRMNCELSGCKKQKKFKTKTKLALPNLWDFYFYSIFYLAAESEVSSLTFQKRWMWV